MKKPFKIKLSTPVSTNFTDAEALFRDLKNRDPRIQHLWSHQADIIRTYHKNIKQRDIALELPTGAGKTLVGLLIAEWRRLSLGERVVYLCPTRQLARQVGLKATEYGINAHVLVGRQSQYPAGHFSDYASAQAIVITTYSGLFNTNPRLDSPETIILDDAHAAENYIAKMWSLSISRFESKTLYGRFIDLFATELSDYLILRDDNVSPHEKQSIDLIPTPKLLPKVQALTDLLNASAEGSEFYYPWTILRGRLHACCVFVSWSEILIRPWTPPSLTHSPFASAKQRVYMSATLGAGGDLERVTGVPKIFRIPVPSGWDKQSTGRRLFLFPDRSFSPDQYEAWLIGQIQSAKRSLVLTPHRLVLKTFEDLVSKYGVTHRVFYSQDVEDTLDSFIDSADSILLLMGRYDGIDLPGDACRVLVVYGLPASVNLQERFLWSKLGMSSVLRDRILTRITQAVGRCTRNSTDYAVIVMAGENLSSFCVTRENKSEFHPELRAEMEFGLDNSDTTNLEDLTSLANLFLTRDAAWNDAEKDIAKRRDETSKSPKQYLESLIKVVSLEIEYQYDLWKDDYNAALIKSTNIIDNLSGDDLVSYRALWNYFAGCTSYSLGQLTGDDNLIITAADRFRRASQSIRTLSWFAKLAHEIRPNQSDHADEDSMLYLISCVTEAVHQYLINLGAVGTKFDRFIGEYSKQIQSNDAEKFEKAFTELGKMLGFHSEKPDETAAPDSVWTLNSQYVLLFECKSDETPTDGISVRTCRQAQGHIAWQKSRPFFTQNAKILSIVISPRSFLEEGAVPHADDLFYVSVEDVRNLFRQVESCLRSIRSKLPDSVVEDRLQLIQDSLISSEIDPEKIIKRFTHTSLKELHKGK